MQIGIKSTVGCVCIGVAWGKGQRDKVDGGFWVDTWNDSGECLQGGFSRCSLSVDLQFTPADWLNRSKHIVVNTMVYVDWIWIEVFGMGVR